MKIKVKTFSEYRLLDLNDFYKKIGDYLKKNKVEECQVDGIVVSRENCKRHGYKFYISKEEILSKAKKRLVELGEKRELLDDKIEKLEWKIFEMKD